MADRWLGTAFEHSWERLLFAPGIFFLIGTSAALLIFPGFALPSILAFTLADSAGAFFGHKYGRSRLLYNPEKTMEKTLVFFGVAFAVLLPFVPLFTDAVIAFGAMMLESVCAAGTDNLVMPLARYA